MRILTDRIHMLDALTANQIAAGEVVERPFSVVKELVENAIDAGATSIRVRLFDAGCEKIQVVDNGSGMSPTDMRMSVLRHATSKIAKAEDLQNLTTLGFRGEALPSIAAVSHLTIISKQPEAQVAYRMTVEEGKAAVPEECAAPDGTTVLVEQLFYNTPARKKFLKTQRTEVGLISDFVGKLAICRPDIAFTLLNGNHRAVVTKGKGRYEDCILAIYGRDAETGMLRLKENSAGIDGFVSQPSFNRPNRNQYCFFVNHRLVRCKELSQAVDLAYQGFIPENRYALVFLFLELPPDSVDVNVHPGKLEIKLREPLAVREAVREAIYNTEMENPLARSLFNSPLRNSAYFGVMDGPNPGQDCKVRRTVKPAFNERRPISGSELYKALYTSTMPERRYIADTIMSQEQIQDMIDKAEAKFGPAEAGQGIAKLGASETKTDLLSTPPTASCLETKPSVSQVDSPIGSAEIRQEPNDSVLPSVDGLAAMHQELTQPTNAGSPVADETVGSIEETVLCAAPPVQPPAKPVTEKPEQLFWGRARNQERETYSALQVIGQFAGMFILAADGEQLYFIDQHAAAERVRYERIKAQAEQAGNDTVLLAVPLHLHLTYQEHLLLTDLILSIRDLGFILEYFGETSYVIRGVPQWLGERDPEHLLRQLLEQLPNHPELQSAELRREELFRMACRSAVKANQYLTPTDITTLFRDLDACQEPYTCPHGRPIACRITAAEICKRFLRNRI